MRRQTEQDRKTNENITPAHLGTPQNATLLAVQLLTLFPLVLWCAHARSTPLAAIRATFRLHPEQFRSTGVASRTSL
jgi:hypothetical protein